MAPPYQQMSLVKMAWKERENWRLGTAAVKYAPGVTYLALVAISLWPKTRHNEAVFKGGEIQPSCVPGEEGLCLG